MRFANQMPDLAATTKALINRDVTNMHEGSENTEAKTQFSVQALRIAQNNEEMAASRDIFARGFGRPGTSKLDFGTQVDLYGADGRWHFQNSQLPAGQDLAGKLKEWLWNDARNVPRDTVNGAWPVVEQLAIKANDGAQGHFKPSDDWHDLDLAACGRAYDAFPKLAQYQLPREIVAGLILNELRHRDPKDGIEDLSVGMTGTVRNYDGSENATASIGPAQMQIGTIRELVKKYPQLANVQDPVKAALDPDKAPLFVAGYLSEHIINLEQHNLNSAKPVPINSASLLYSYNPDVAVRNDLNKPSSPDDYRAYTAAEKVENSITHKRSATAADWHSVWFATDDKITAKSEVVQNMLDGIAVIKKYKIESGR